MIQPPATSRSYGSKAKKATVVTVVALVLATLAAPSASADLSRRDPNDVSIRLDLRRVSSAVYRSAGSDRMGMSLEFWRSVPRRLRPRINVWYDAFGSQSADYLLAFHFFRYGSSGCRLVRLADRRNLESSEVDEQWRYLYCETRRPGGMQGHSVRWRVGAVLRGAGRDLAPNIGWFPHT